MFAMFEHAVMFVYVQYACHEDIRIDITLVQNILLDFIVILLSFSYNFAYILG